MEVRVDQSLKRILSVTCPEFKGRTLSLESSSKAPRELNSYWDNGYKDYWAFYHLASGKVVQVQSNHPFYEAGRPRDLESLPDGVLLVRHTYSGTRQFVTVYANEKDRAPLLPAPALEVTRQERIVLIAARSLKAGYGGVKESRYVEANRVTGITWEEWCAAKESCTAKGLLNKAGAITVEGKNTVGWADLYSCRVQEVAS